ncbi:MAG TPA: S-layer homology domain-containing protein [Thermoanaerobaculia bacterium]|nr:S-layer homology domain-containing protein [Thermoanaerobaculia bacterium]
MTFSTPGLKQVSLQVCNDHGCDTKITDVVVLNPMPQIGSLGSIPAAVGVGQPVTFSAQATGRPSLTYRWILSSGMNNVTLLGNPAVWDTKSLQMGTYTGRLEVQNTEGTATSGPFDIRLSRMTFGDVPPTHWAWRSVEAIYDQGITSGCSASPLLYCPTLRVNRAEMAVFLVRTTQGATFVPAAAAGVFADVLPAHWAAPSIEQIFRDGITQGCLASPLSYCPTTPVDRAEMAVFLLRAKHGAAYLPPPATGNIFSDVAATHWAASWIEQLYNEGITTGCGSNPQSYCPNNTVSRAEMAVFLTRTFDVPLPAIP